MRAINIYHFLKSSLIIALMIFSPNLLAQQERFEAGLAAKDRGHYATALRSWLPMADTGDAQAQNNVGFMYEGGLGVSQSYLIAMDWYRKAADSGLAEAQHNIGMLYHHGYGVAANPVEALRWFKLAADQELPQSEYMLGLAYENGNGSPLDYTAARKLLLSSALKNYAPAQMMYAFMLQAGEGGDSDSFKAYIWAKVAEKNGQASAIDITSIANLALDDEELIEAETIVNDCLNIGLNICPI